MGEVPSDVAGKKAGIAPLLVGMLTGLIGGPIVYYAIALITTWISSFIGDRLLMALCWVVFLYVFALVVMAYLIAKVINTIGEARVGQPLASAPKLSAVAGLVAFGSFLVTYFIVLGEESLDSIIDYGKIVIAFIILVGGSFFAAKEGQVSKPENTSATDP